MKRIIAVLIGITLLGTPSLQARQYNDGPKNDFSISYGYFTIPQFAVVLGGVFGAAFSLGYATPSEITSSGSVKIEYLHKTNYWLWLGAGLSGEMDSLKMVSKDSDGNVLSTMTNNIITGNLVGTAKANWLRRPKFAMYTKVSAGIFSTFGDDDNQISPSIQLSLLGLEGGGENFRGFIEFGAGMQGLVNGGLRFLF